MPSCLANKKCKIIIVDPSGPVRQLMTETVRNAIGFENVEGKGSVQDALQHLEADRADWMILPLMADQQVNALHLLKLCSEHADLRSVRVSLLLEEEEKYAIAPAFELGLLSFHRKPFTKDTLTEELKALFTQLEANGYNETLTSAHYLRTHLKAAKQYAAQADLERGLLDIFPGNAPILLESVEPQFHLGKKDLAKVILTQVKMIDPKLSDKADALAKELFGADASVPANTVDENGAPVGGSINVVGAETAVIIDSDDAAGRGAEDLLKRLGVATVHRFSNGEAAWEHLSKNPEPGLVLTEWRVPKLSGPMIVQRIRHHGFLTVPIIVHSSLLKPDDMPLVREIGVATIILKPLNKDLFVPGLIGTMQQERMPSDQQVLERKIRHLLKAGKRDEAEPLRAQLLSNAQIPLARKRLVEAEFAFAKGDYQLARDAAVDALKHAGDGLLVLNLLGKCFMRLSQHEAALKCFNKAQEMSPHNIERLCMIAETQTELGDQAAAKETLGDARALDPDAAAIAETDVKNSIATGDTETAKRLMGSFDSIDSIVSYMNNKAVALAKCGKAHDAIGVYKKTLESIPNDKADPKSIVLYNLALAQIRDGEYDAALGRLADVLKIKGSKVEKKASSLKDRLKVARDQGTEFKLKGDTGDKPAAGEAHGTNASTAGGGDDPASGKDATGRLASEEEHRRLLSVVEVRRGDLCCYLLFNAKEAGDPRAVALLAKPPRFTRRVAIARQESMGADRVSKESA